MPEKPSWPDAPSFRPAAKSSPSTPPTAASAPRAAFAARARSPAPPAATAPRRHSRQKISANSSAPASLTSLAAVNSCRWSIRMSSGPSCWKLNPRSGRSSCGELTPRSSNTPSQLSGLNPLRHPGIVPLPNLKAARNSDNRAFAALHCLAIPVAARQPPRRRARLQKRRCVPTATDGSVGEKTFRLRIQRLQNLRHHYWYVR